MFSSFEKHIPDKSIVTGGRNGYIRSDNPIQMKAIFVLAIVIGHFICSAQVTPELPGQAGTPQEYQVWLKQNHVDPDEYVTSKFRQHDLVMLGEDHAILQNLVFVTKLIPKLYQNGVYNLGMEFGASEVQARLDSLVSAPAFSLDVARDLMYCYNTGWAYLEYYQIAEAVWKLNRTLSKDAPRFRILNLSYQYDWSGFKKGDVRTDEVMKRIFPKGTPDQYRGTIVDKEVMSKKQKALLLVGTPHAYTRYSSCHYDFLKDNFIRCDSDWLGQRLLRNYPGKVFNILLHQPFPNNAGSTPWLVSPGGGMVEQIMALNANKPVGFDLSNTPLGRIPDDSHLALGYKDFTLGQYFDGYLFLAPFHELKGCTFDPAFFDDKPWEQIKTQIPDPDWRESINSLDDFRKQIEGFVNIKQRYRDLMK